MLLARQRPLWAVHIHVCLICVVISKLVKVEEQRVLLVDVSCDASDHNVDAEISFNRDCDVLRYTYTYLSPPTFHISDWICVKHRIESWVSFLPLLPTCRDTIGRVWGGSVARLRCMSYREWSSGRKQSDGPSCRIRTWCVWSVCVALLTPACRCSTSLRSTATFTSTCSSTRRTPTSPSSTSPAGKPCLWFVVLTWLRIVV